MTIVKKRIVIYIVAVATMSGAGAATRPAVDAFLDTMAIAVTPGQHSRFVAGDNVAGYYEGYTQASDRGVGYMIRDEAVFQGYASFVNRAPNQRFMSGEQVLPYGHHVRHTSGATETFALLSKQQAVALRVTAPSAGVLAIRPLLKAAGARSQHDGTLTIAPGKGQTLHAAISANAPVTIADDFTVTGSSPSRQLTVVVAFAPTAAAAAQRARSLSQADPIAAERKALHAALTKSYLATSDATYNKALNWSKAASRMFVVEEFGTGIWAGLPWFRDNWGRDTFIALPGTLLVSGQFADARAVLANFARYQNLREPRDREYGRIPNRVAAGDSIIYNTVDGTPWMLREALEYIRYTGDRDFARQALALAIPYFEGAIANYVDADGLLAHDSADTWMDARIDNKQPWSARGPRAVEIQALWYTALQTGADLAGQAGDTERAMQWSTLAARAKARFLTLYWDGKVMADRLRADDSRDTKVRPNQLMLVSIPFDDFIPPAVQAAVTRNAVSQLLYPYGIASLSEDDPYFHPRHENPAFHHKDASYHQGTIWGWNAGYTVTALNKFGYQDMAWQLAQNLGNQILGLGTLGNMSELLDALPHEGGKLTPSGTYAQSWSVAEYARNGYQDFVGFRPDLTANMLAFYPAIPSAWSRFEALLPFGTGEEIAVDFARSGSVQRWTLRLTGGAVRTVTFAFLNADKSRSTTRFALTPGKQVTLRLAAGRASVNGKALAVAPQLASQAGVIGALAFRRPRPYRAEDFPMLKGKDVLKGVIERGEYR